MRNQSKWQFTIYDALDRPLMTGLMTSTQTRGELNSILTQPGVYLATSVFYHVRNYQTWASYPATLDDAVIHTYTYYDNYNELPGTLAFDASQFPAVSNVLVTAPALNPVTRGMVTGSKVRIMDPDYPMADDWTVTAFFYDPKGRQIQSQTLNHTGGKDIFSSMYYFQGTLFKSIQRHENPLAKALDGANDTLDTFTIEKTYTRNFKQGGGNDLVATVKQKINGGSDFDLAQYSYDHLNRVTVTATPAAMTLFEYYVHGGLKRINARNNNNAPGEQHIFEEVIYYDTGFASRYYDGNISGVKWKKAGDNSPYEVYGYTYDKTGRMTHAEHRRDAGSVWTNAIVDYTVSGLDYDFNGNILSMKQRGMKPGFGAPVTIDSLTYTYTPVSNRLRKVEDAIHPDTTILLPDFKNGANVTTEYTYDPNGNVLTDANKKITGITYNHLDKPVVVNFDGGRKFTYVYDATGNLLQKKVHDGTTTEIYDYLGNFVYLDSTLQYFTHEEGRCRPVVAADTLTGFAYDYFIKDHLGNVRTTVTATEPVTQQLLAQMELASAQVEQLVFENIAVVRENKPLPAVGDLFAAHLDANNPETSIGPSILLELMPGDRIGVSVDAYYDGDMDDDSELDMNMVINALHGALTGGNNYGGIPMSELPENVHRVNMLLSNPGLLSEFGNVPIEEESEDAPKAYLNMLVFDGDMNFVIDASRRWQVDDNGIAWHTIGDDFTSMIDYTDGGNVFVLIFVNNTSIGKGVWFDDLRITLHRGKILEQNHYYPHGLAITSKAPEAKEQPYKYQSVSLERRFGYEMEETFYRSLDPQLGRFWQVDPKPNHHLSPYASMGNNPAMLVDPLGDTTRFFSEKGAYIGTINDNLPNQSHFVNVLDMGNILEDIKTINNSPTSPEYRNRRAAQYRSTSIAYVGENTEREMIDLANHGTENGHEVGFVVLRNALRELSLVKLSDDYVNDINGYSLREAVNETYSTREQAKLFGAGHVHHGKLWHAGSPTTPGLDRETDGFRYLGEPTIVDDRNPYSRDSDYQSVLYRHPNARQPGQSPAFIVTPFGYTIYGTGTSYFGMGDEKFRYIPNKVVPNNYNSYIKYNKKK